MMGSPRETLGGSFLLGLRHSPSARVSVLPARGLSLPAALILPLLEKCLELRFCMLLKPVTEFLVALAIDLDRDEALITRQYPKGATRGVLEDRL